MKFDYYKKKVFFKIISIFSSIFAIILFLTTIFSYIGIKHFVYIKNKEHLSHEIIEILAIITGPNGIEIDNYKEGSIDRDFYFRIFDKENHIIFQSKNNYQQLISNESEEIMLRQVPIVINNENLGTLEVFKYNENEDRFLKRIFSLIVFLNFLGLLSIFFMGRIFINILSKPLNQIKEAINNIKISNLKNRIELRGTGDEFDQLSTTLNTMLDRLQQGYDSQKQFSSNVSHELRTPLAVIKGHIDMLKKWGKANEEILEESLDTIKKETEDMIFMIERLLFLAKEENEKYSITKIDFNPSEVISEIILESKVIDSDHTFINESQNCIMNGDRILIKQMLRALMDNSIKYTKNNGKITLGSFEKNEKIYIFIKDDGMGISEEHIKNIFDRFYRINPDRNKETGGSGLGLSIVKSIVDLHEGEIKIKSIPDNGTNIISIFNKI
jgi:signal transduction histidine kinase